MQRHLSTGSTLVSALMAAQRRSEPSPWDDRDVVRLLGSLGDRGPRRQSVPPAAPREEDLPPAA